MIMKPLYIIVLISALFTLHACATVKLTRGGEKARVLSTSEAANCKKLGATRVSVKPTLLTVPRQQKVIKKELRILARNSAVSMGGDTASPISKIDNGQQKFAVYQCVP